MRHSHRDTALARQNAVPAAEPDAPGRDGVFVDLVCEGIVRRRADTLAVAWDQDTYYFCSPFCQRRFAPGPQAFVPSRRANSDDIMDSGDNHAAA